MPFLLPPGYVPVVTIQYPSSLLANYIISWLLFTSNVVYKKHATRSWDWFILASSLFLSASIFPNNYEGQLITGFSYSILMTISVQMPNNWFPQREIGKALVTFPFFDILASVLAIVIPSNVFRSVSSMQQNTTRESNRNYTNILSLDYTTTFVVNYSFC